MNVCPSGSRWQGFWAGHLLGIFNKPEAAALAVAKYRAQIAQPVEVDAAMEDQEETEEIAKQPAAEGGRSVRNRKPADYTSNHVSYDMSSEVEAVQAAPKRGRHADEDHGVTDSIGEAGGGTCARRWVRRASLQRLTASSQLLLTPQTSRP